MANWPNSENWSNSPQKTPEGAQKHEIAQRWPKPREIGEHRPQELVEFAQVFVISLHFSPTPSISDGSADFGAVFDRWTKTHHRSKLARPGPNEMGNPSSSEVSLGKCVSWSNMHGAHMCCNHGKQLATRTSTKRACVFRYTNMWRPGWSCWRPPRVVMAASGDAAIISLFANAAARALARWCGLLAYAAWRLNKRFARRSRACSPTCAERGSHRMTAGAVAWSGCSCGAKTWCLRRSGRCPERLLSAFRDGRYERPRPNGWTCSWHGLDQLAHGTRTREGTAPACANGRVLRYPNTCRPEERCCKLPRGCSGRRSPRGSARCQCPPPTPERHP